MMHASAHSFCILFWLLLPAGLLRHPRSAKERERRSFKEGGKSDFEVEADFLHIESGMRFRAGSSCACSKKKPYKTKAGDAW